MLIGRGTKESVIEWVCPNCGALRAAAFASDKLPKMSCWACLPKVFWAIPRKYIKKKKEVYEWVCPKCDKVRAKGYFISDMNYFCHKCAPKEIHWCIARKVKKLKK